MTNAELNRDIKRLVKRCESLESDPNAYHVAQKEFHRLYNADDKFEVMTKQNVLWMLRLNVRHRFVPLHTFGLQIDLPNE